MKTALDTNVLLDLLAGDPSPAKAAHSAIASALGLGSVAICPIVYAELGAGFLDQEELGRFIRALHIQVDTFSPDALFLAATTWRQYTQHRGKQVQCPRCGQQNEVLCPNCCAYLSWRQHILPDFLVGAHAATQCDRLLTRDSHFHRTYYPTVAVLVP